MVSSPQRSPTPAQGSPPVPAADADKRPVTPLMHVRWAVWPTPCQRHLTSRCATIDAHLLMSAPVQGERYALPWYSVTETSEQQATARTAGSRLVTAWYGGLRRISVGRSLIWPLKLESGVSNWCTVPGVAGSRADITAVRSLMVLCLGGRSVQSQVDLLFVGHATQWAGTGDGVS